MNLTSRSFTHGDPIPRQFTCEGQDISPELSWMDAPEETKSFALILHDPDAPRANGFTHWVVYNIPPNTSRLEEHSAKSPARPSVIEGNNDSGKAGYIGPCPPSGKHRYFFRLYALDKQLDLPAGATRDQVSSAMEGHILAQAELMGTYEKAARKTA